MSAARTGRPFVRRSPTRFAQPGSSGQARIVIGTVCAPIGTWIVVSLYALGRSATK
jgi:hypothetical protein